MPLLILTLFILGILLPASASPPLGIRQSSLPLVFTPLIKSLPTSEVQGLTDYMSVIGVQVDRQENNGIRGFNTKILKHACLDNLAAEFYADLQNDMSVLRRPKNQNLVPNSLDGISQGDFPPGWLWKKALKFSNGKKLLAMQLIGFCGHDDVNQVEIGSFKPARNSKRSSSRVDCPRAGDPVFTPGSLGAETILPLVLKQKIARIQAPKKGMSALPAKYYHTIGAAYTSCFMVRRGVPDWITSRAVKGAINAYRAGRICDELIHIGWKGHMNTSAKQILEFNCKSKPAAASRPECGLQRTADLLAGKNLPVREKKFRRYLASIRAAELFQRSSYYLGAKRCDGHQLNRTVRNYFEEYGTLGRSNPCPTAMPKQDCSDIREVMATWAIDFERDEAQHMAGLNFARKNCPVIGKNEDPLAHTCAALKAAIQIPPISAEKKPNKSGSAK